MIFIYIEIFFLDIFVMLIIYTHICVLVLHGHSPSRSPLWHLQLSKCLLLQCSWCMKAHFKLCLVLCFCCSMFGLRGVEAVSQSWGLLLQSDRSAPLIMMKYQTHSCTLITNGLTGNDDGGVWVHSSSLIMDYFQSSLKASHAATNIWLQEVAVP